MSNSPDGAASATYRKAVNSIADAPKQEPSHSKYPSHDFDVALESITEALKEKAIEWYKRGIKRGLGKATDLMASKEIYSEKGFVYEPQKIKINVKTKCAGGNWESHEMIVKSSEIGFK